MPISFPCPHCQARMNVPDQLAGKRGKCSKCKGNVIVPAPAGNGDDTSASKTPPPLPPSAPAAPVDLEAAALSVLADEPNAADAAPEVIAFHCPQCDEPIEVDLELAGKKHPCPSCRRIISIPYPKENKKKDWRDTGPKLPAAARRPEEPAPEGAWGSTNKTGPSIDSLREAGVLKEKEKPLTLYQRFQPYVLVGTPILLLLLGGWFLWSWLAAGREKAALDAALAFASSEGARKEIGPAGMAALHAGAGQYFLGSPRSDSAEKVREQLNQAVTLAQSSRDPARDALLIDIARLRLALGGTDAQISAGTRLKWDDIQRLLRSDLATIAAPEARLEALREVCSGLASQGQTERALALALQVYPVPGADQCEALATAGLELFRHGHRDDALRAAEQAEAAFAVEQDRPALRPAVVALSVALERKPPSAGKGLTEEENVATGWALGRALLGKLEEARTKASDIRSPDQRFRAFVGIASATEKSADDVQAALDQLAAARERPGLSWTLLRLVPIGLRAGTPVERLESVVTAIPDRSLASWGQLLLYRAGLDSSRSLESVDALGKLPANSLAGLLARTELARHNTRQSSSWQSQLATWDDAPRAFGSLGVALGLQKR